MSDLAEAADALEALEQPKPVRCSWKWDNPKRECVLSPVCDGICYQDECEGEEMCISFRDQTLIS